MIRGRTLGLLLLVLGCAGCRQILGLSDREADASIADDTTPSDSDVLDPDGPPPDGPADDLDNDAVLNDDDNCPLAANTNQFDEDADSVGDACDNCPHLINIDQLNADADGAGDICDPHPALADQILVFAGFADNALPAGWTGTNWTFSNGQAVSPGTAFEVLFTNVPSDTAVISARIASNVATEGIDPSLGVAMGINATLDDGIGCTLDRSTAPPSLEYQDLQGAGTANPLATQNAGEGDTASAFTFDLEHAVRCRVARQGGATVITPFTTSTHTNIFGAVRIKRAVARVDWVVIIGPP